MERANSYAGAGWVEATYKLELSPFAREVADLLGDVWKGIYHLDDKQLKKVDWKATQYIRFLWRGTISTFDFCEMTDLVLAAHDRGIRVEVSAVAPGWLVFMFHPRGSTALCGMHPTIEKAIARHRKQFGDRRPQPPEVDEEAAAFDEWAGRVSSQPPGVGS